MRVTHVKLENWRNFKTVDVDLADRTFLVGPNASGKSNLLDVFRFLRDISNPAIGGGLQKAVAQRGGLSKIRCLAARRNPRVEIEVTVEDRNDNLWRYSLGLEQEPRGRHQTFVAYERVWKENEQILDRPTVEDETDPLRLSQTHLEQISANKKFRPVAEFLGATLYLHLVPQLLRYPDSFAGPGMSGDPFGRSFLERLASTSDATRRARLLKIEQALRLAVPQLKSLTYVRDEKGSPHLQALYEHWRMKAAKQQEDQFSDGTLRLLALLWSLLESNSLLLLEEPELSLHAAIAEKLPGLIYRLQKSKKRQVLTSTHSADLLGDKGIGGEEILILEPSPEGTKVTSGACHAQASILLKNGLSAADVAIPVTRPDGSAMDQLELF